MLITSGDVAETLNWMNDLDHLYGITDDNYNMGDFIQDLKDKGYIDEDGDGNMGITPKTERDIRKRSLEDVFGKLKKSGRGNHSTNFNGRGNEVTNERRQFEFGDDLEQISLSDSIKNAHINHGINDFYLQEDDLEVVENEYQTITSTVLMIDISHSMILYGEDRITPAKKVALALSELIKMKYPKDTLDVVVFGNDAWQIKLKELPYLEVGPYHTNTVAGLELSIDILKKKKTNNKQIFMITDGKPTCLKEGLKYYKNSFGFDRKILNKTFNLGRYCRKLDIPVTTFMIASDPYLRSFVEEFTEINNGKAYFSSLEGLGDIIFEDFNKKKRK